VSATAEATPPASPAQAAAAAPAATPPKSKKRLVLMLGAGVLVGGIGLGAFAFMKRPAKTEDKEKVEAPTSAGEKKKTQVITLRPIVVNLRNSKGTRYLKVTVAMETATEEVAKELQNLSPQISDLLVDKFSNVDINDVDNTAGRNKLKRELLSGTNELLEKGYVNTVYFTEFVIQ
jgi:flagellar FliL protein